MAINTCRCANIRIKMKVRRKRMKPSVLLIWRTARLNDPDLNRLYELIWKRTIASQMSDAELEKTTAKIDISTNKEELTATRRSD